MNDLMLEILLEEHSKSNVTVITSDPSIRGLHTVKRVTQLIDELKLNIKQTYLVVTRVVDKLSDDFSKQINELELELAGIIPSDESVLEYDSNGRPLIELPLESKAVQAVKNILGKIIEN